MHYKQDPYWQAALRVALSLSEEHKLVLVPEEFVNERESFWPVKQSGQLSQGGVDAFVIPKYDLKYLPVWLVEDNGFRCIYADDVFVGYTSLDEEPVNWEEIKKQQAGFRDMRRKYLAGFNEQTDNSLLTGTVKLPYLLDSKENRLLQCMFPHQHYLYEQFEDMSGAPKLIQQEIFKYCVSAVRIELSGYCNRSCAYCPVSFLERKDKEAKIDIEVFERCLDDLAKIDYSGELWFCLFNEPLYDKEFLFWALDIVNEKLPNAFLKIVTNGDYLTVDYFRKLQKRRIDEFTISVHYDGKWNEDKQTARIYEMLKRINLEPNGYLDKTEGRIVFYVNEDVYDSRRLRQFSLRTEDFAVHGMDRGGTLEIGILKERNFGWCALPFDQFNIAYDGSVVPCCNICSDVQQVKGSLYGNIRDFNSVFAAYCSVKAAAFRRCMFVPRSEAEFTPAICATCSVGSYDNNKKIHELDNDLRNDIKKSWFEKSAKGEE